MSLSLLKLIGQVMVNYVSLQYNITTSFALKQLQNGNEYFYVDINQQSLDSLSLNVLFNQDVVMT